MRFFFTIMLLLATQCFAQFGGTKAVEDTMRLEDKFHAYKVSKGQRFVSSNVNADTSHINFILKVPITETLPTCSSLIKGVIVMRSTDNRLYFCNGTSYGLVAYDGDLDGLTSAIDANDASAFTAGTAAAPDVLTAKTFYTGPNMTETTGTMPNNGNQTFTSDGVKSAGYYSGITVNVVASGTADTDAGGAQILTGYEAWNSTGGLVDGTMPNQGSPTFSNDDVSISAGYYSGGTINVIASGTGDTDAGGGQILTGYEAWNATGSVVDGTMPNRGSPTFTTDDVSISSGYYSGGSISIIDAGTGDANAVGGQILTGYEAWGSTGSLIDGTMPNRGSPTFNTDDVSISSGYYSGGSINVIASGTGDTDAGGAQILTGYEAWNATGSVVDGTMPNRGAPTFNTDDVSLDAGYYSGGTINVISSGTADTDASGAQILTGYEAWNSTGGVVDGTMTNRGSPTFSSDDVSIPSGYYSGGTINVISSGTGDTDAGGAQILTGYEAWNGAGGLVDGTMPNRGSPTFSSDDVSLDAGYYSGGSINVIASGTGDTDASGGQILTGYEAWNSTGSVVDGTMPNKGAGSFTADGSYTTGYAGYYSSISVDVVAAGTADTDAGGAQIRGGYEAWGSTGGLIDGTMVDQAGGTYNATSGTSGSDLLATGGRYLTSDVRVNKVTSTATINHGQTASSGPYRSVTCNSASTGFSVSGPTAGTSGTNIGKGNQITINANDGSASSTYHCQVSTTYAGNSSACGTSYWLRRESYLPLTPGYFCLEKCGATTVIQLSGAASANQLFDYDNGSGTETPSTRRCISPGSSFPIWQNITCGC